ncbi:MAG: hypothetical protein ACE5IL_08145 [Myxococcota bacterium]
MACYGPYNLWDLHGMWEITILQALKLRGAEVRHLACDGLYSDCDLFWKATQPRHALSCLECQARVSGLMLGMRMEFEWLGRYLTPEEHDQARCWVEEIHPCELPEARFGDWNVGEWVRSSVHSHLRRSTLSLEVPEVEEVYRSYVFSGLVACFSLERFLRVYDPQVLFLLSGRLSSTRVALELARRKGVRVVCHERGLLRESVKLFDGSHSLALKPFPDLWRDWGCVPLAPAELDRIQDYMKGREQGRNLGERCFSPPPGSPVRERIGLSRDRETWVLFVSSEDEVIATPERSGPFSSQLEWIEQTVSYVAKHPELDLVIRIHPNIGSQRSIGRNLDQLREFQELGERLPKNVFMVMPEEDVSSYSLMDLASVGLVYISITGLEMACKGKRVVAAAGAWVRYLPFVYSVRERDDYEAILDGLRVPPPEELTASIERMAYRFAYALYFRWNIPFPLVKMPDAHSGRLAYASIDDLQPGRDTNLDRIARILLEGEPVCRPPDRETRTRPLEAELDWFRRRGRGEGGRVQDALRAG